MAGSSNGTTDKVTAVGFAHKNVFNFIPVFANNAYSVFYSIYPTHYVVVLFAVPKARYTTRILSVHWFFCCLRHEVSVIYDYDKLPYWNPIMIPGTR